MKFKKPKRKVTEVFLHHSATDKPEHDDIRWIKKLHVEKNGWANIGYHYFINSKGVIQKGRSLEKIPAAQQGHNTGTIAICLSGIAGSFNHAQFMSLKQLCRAIDMAYDFPMRFVGHKEVMATECPHYDYKAILGLDDNGFFKVRTLNKKGAFIGTVKSEWLTEDGKKLPWYKRYTSWFFEWDADRKMKILEDFSYIDKNGLRWTCKEGSIVDGASIPKAFWKVIGPPLTGDYRRASVIHDVYCDSKERPHKEVHEVFHEMLLVDGVPKVKAEMMGLAVKMFGPKW